MTDDRHPPEGPPPGARDEKARKMHDQFDRDELLRHWEWFSPEQRQQVLHIVRAMAAARE